MSTPRLLTISAGLNPQLVRYITSMDIKSGVYSMSGVIAGLSSFQVKDSARSKGLRENARKTSFGMHPTKLPISPSCAYEPE